MKSVVIICSFSALVLLVWAINPVAGIVTAMLSYGAANSLAR
jgi:hypothetical protein